MALTLTELKAMSADYLTPLVIDEAQKSSFILQNLTFDTAAALAQDGSWNYVYRRRTTSPGAATRALNSDYTASEGKVTKYSVECKIFGGSFQVDRASVGVQVGLENIAFQIQQKTLATVAEFNNLFINGDSGSVATEFDGLDVALTGTSTEYSPTAPIEIQTMADITTNYESLRWAMRQWLKTLNGRPDAFLCNADLLSALLSVNDKFALNTETRDSIGQSVPTWMGVPLIDLGELPASSNPVIATDGTAGTTSLYAVRFGLDAVHGVAPTEARKTLAVYTPQWVNGDDADAVKKGAVEGVMTIALKATRAAGVFRDIQVAEAAP